MSLNQENTSQKLSYINCPRKMPSVGGFSSLKTNKKRVKRTPRRINGLGSFGVVTFGVSHIVESGALEIKDCPLY